MRGGPGCGDRDRFQDFVRNMFGYASVKNFVGTLSTLAHMQNREGQAGTVCASEHSQSARRLLQAGCTRMSAATSWLFTTMQQHPHQDVMLG